MSSPRTKPGCPWAVADGTSVMAPTLAAWRTWRALTPRACQLVEARSVEPQTSIGCRRHRHGSCPDGSSEGTFLGRHCRSNDRRADDAHALRLALPRHCPDLKAHWSRRCAIEMRPSAAGVPRSGPVSAAMFPDDKVRPLRNGAGRGTRSAAVDGRGAGRLDPSTRLD